MKSFAAPPAPTTRTRCPLTATAEHPERAQLAHCALPTGSDQGDDPAPAPAPAAGRGTSIDTTARDELAAECAQPSCREVDSTQSTADGHSWNDAGMSTVEYAIGTVVAAAFAAVLYRVVTGDSVVAGLTSLVQSALHTAL